MTRKIFYSIDVLLCCIFLMFAYHNMQYYHFPLLCVALPGILLTVFPAFLHINIDFLLYRKEKMAVWPILVYMAVFIFYMYYPIYNSNGLAWRHCLNLIQSVYKETFYIPMNEVVYEKSFYSEWKNLTVAMLDLWTAFMPICAYAILFFRKRLEKKSISFGKLFGSYMFYDKAGKRFLQFAAIFACAYVLGRRMDSQLSSAGVVVLPTVAYYFLNKYIGNAPHKWEYAVLILALSCFANSQHIAGTPKIVMMIASAVVIFMLCVRMFVSTRKWTTSLLTLLLVGFVIPIFTMGYNVFVGADCGRLNDYTDQYIRRGVSFVYSEVNGDMRMGIRSRYRVVLPTKYKSILPIVSPEIYADVVTEKGDTIKRLVHTRRVREVMAYTADGDSVIYCPAGDFYVDPITNEWRYPTEADLKK